MKHILTSLFLLSNLILFSQNFSVNTATYIGGNAIDDEINGVDVAPNGNIVVIGKLPGFNPGNVTPLDLKGGGDGVIVRYGSDGTTVLSITRLPGKVYDIEIGNQGQIAICGSFGVGVLNATASDFLWSDISITKGSENAHTNTFFGWYNITENKARYKRAMSRISIGTDGTVATVQQATNYGNSQMKFYNPQGNVLFDTIFKAQISNTFPDYTCNGKAYQHMIYPEDICVDGDNGHVILGGWNPRHDKSRHMDCHPIHMPFMYCFDYTGKRIWKNYDWRPWDVYWGRDYYADSRINEVVIGRDGMLYMAGYIHGGDHMFILNPTDYMTFTGKHVGYDNYSNATNMGAGIDQAYFAKYDPTNGNILKSQACMVRKKPNGTDKPNQSLIKGIMADENGKVYLAGYCQPYVKNRSSLTVNNTAVGERDTSEAFVMVVNPDWLSREVWTVFTADKSESTFWGLGYRNGLAVAAGEVFGGTMITSSNALQSTSSTLYDGYMVSWGSFVSAKESTLNPIQMYPNPAKNFVKFENANNASIEILDLAGRVLYQNRKLSSNQLDITFLPTGLYVVNINTGKQIFNFKLVKQ